LTNQKLYGIIRYTQLRVTTTSPTNRKELTTMKKIFIRFNNEDWLDEYDFLRDVVGIVKEETKGNVGIMVYVNETDYNNAMEEV
jgi:hypothetical protein